MLKSELYELEISVGAIIEQNSTVAADDFSPGIAERVANIKSLCSELKKKWTQELLTNAKEQVVKRYVQYHQAGVTKLSDKVSSVSPISYFTAAEQATLPETFRQLNEELANVLEFLRQQFYQYFDIDHKATIYSCQKLASKISGFEQDIKNYKGEVDRSLIEVIFISLNEMAKEGSFIGISWRLNDHLLNVARLVHQFLCYGSHTTTEALIKVLYQQNFNSLYFYNWYRRHLQQQFSALTDKKERTDFINKQIGILEGIFVNPDKCIQAELPSTDRLIIPWLQEQSGAVDLRSEQKRSAEQFPLNLSVPQFALFIRIFYKTGCFPVENVAMITRFFSEHFTTKKQAHISHKSFGRAFYDLDQSTAAIVRDYLQKMLNYLNKTYFP